MSDSPWDGESVAEADEFVDAESRLDRIIALGDLDELLREVDRRADDGDWDGLERLRFRARAATERGHQLWPAASWAEYRTALDGPNHHAGEMAVEGTGYLGLGPLTEVVAQHHTWVELATHVPIGPLRSVVAAERVLRGETVADEDVTDLPGRLLPWEPTYALAEYRIDGATFDEPSRWPEGEAVPAGRVLPDEPDAADGTRALIDAVKHWAAHGDGQVRAVGVSGSACDALATLGIVDASWVEVGLTGAMELLAWAAASGGARGRRRGAAAGRFDAWWVAATLAGVIDDWPTDPGLEASELRWWKWSTVSPGRVGGWECCLVVEDPVDGLAWALEGTEPKAT